MTDYIATCSILLIVPHCQYPPAQKKEIPPVHYYCLFKGSCKGNNMQMGSNLCKDSALSTAATKANVSNSAIDLLPVWRGEGRADERDSE
jgi:hypothetical protein